MIHYDINFITFNSKNVHDFNVWTRRLFKAIKIRNHCDINGMIQKTNLPN